MRVLITGVSSLIGSSISNRLLQEGFDVVGLDIVKSHSLRKEIEFFQGDVRDGSLLASAATGCDLGIHLAVLATNAKAADIMSANVFGMYSYLQAAKQAQFQNSIIVSSAPVHLKPSDSDNAIVLKTSDDEDHLYDLTKTLQEVIGRDFHAHGLSVLCLSLIHI